MHLHSSQDETLPMAPKNGRPTVEFALGVRAVLICMACCLGCGEISLAQQTVKLSAVTHSVDVDPTGRFALVAGLHSSLINADYYNPVRSILREKGANHLTLVDLRKGEIIAERTLVVNCSSICLTRDGAFMCTYEDGVLHKLSREDLSTSLGRFTVSEPLALTGLPGARVAVAAETGVTLFSADDLSETSQWGITGDPFREHLLHQYSVYSGWDFEAAGRYDTSPQKLDQGWLMNGVVLNNSCHKVTRVVSSVLANFADTTFIGLDNAQKLSNEFRDDLRIRDPIRQLHPWGRAAFPEGLATRQFQPVAQWQGVARLLPHLPVVALVVIEDEQGKAVPYHDVGRPAPLEDENVSFKIRLELRELVEGREIHRQELFTRDILRGRLQQGGGPNVFAQFCVAAAGERVVVAEGEELHIVALNEGAIASKLEAIQAPLHFVSRQAPLTVKAGEEAQIQLAAEGGMGAIRYELETELPYAKIDAETGVLTIDTAAPWAAYQKHLIEEREYDRSEIEELGSAAQADFAAIFGDETDEIPMQIKFLVTARDDSGQQDTFDSQLIVLGPRQELLELAEAASANDNQLESGADHTQSSPAPSDPAQSGPADQESLAIKGIKVVQLTNAVTQQATDFNAGLAELRARQQANHLADEQALEQLNANLAELSARLEKQNKSSSGTSVTFWLSTAVALIAALACGGTAFVLLSQPRRQKTASPPVQQLADNYDTGL